MFDGAPAPTAYRGSRTRLTRQFSCQPAGTSISRSPGTSTANSAAGPNTICRRQTTTSRHLSRRGAMSACQWMPRGRVSQYTVDCGERQNLAAGISVKPARAFGHLRRRVVV